MVFKIQITYKVNILDNSSIHPNSSFEEDLQVVYGNNDDSYKDEVIVYV